MCLSSGDLQPDSSVLTGETIFPCRASSLSSTSSLMKGGTLDRVTLFVGAVRGDTRHKRIIDNDACLHHFVGFVHVIHKHHHHHRAAHSRSGLYASVSDNLRHAKPHSSTEQGNPGQILKPRVRGTPVTV
ncbi:hypothetical protein L3Q82_007071 [Scortum barcoo]|uniref:Uncharacterized protein n=1 Tax=Scortum barcoo TaxID=214431 RepID=A0ACB8WS17_9TELE|nr:hypothetical protein L3Q82_007071 [Scortum barcoo]